MRAVAQDYGEETEMTKLIVWAMLPVRVALGLVLVTGAVPFSLILTVLGAIFTPKHAVEFLTDGFPDLVKDVYTWVKQ